MSKDNIAAVHDPALRASPVFRDLSDLEFNAVSAFLEPCRVKEGSVIFKEGASGEELFILVSGGVGAWVKQPDGTQRKMFDIKKGDFFGEMSVIANESRSATLKAQGDTELLSLHGIDFYRIIYEHPMIGAKMLKAIGKVQSSWLDETSKSLTDILRWGETARRRAVSDDLTGLYNRAFMEESARDRFKRGSFEIRCVSLLMMDLDKFHDINQKFGIEIGDRLFIATADILRSLTRSEDICSRFSGDEFALFLPDTEIEEAWNIAERVRQAMASQPLIILPKRNDPSQYKIPVNISIGIACAPAHGDTWEKLYIAADSALRRAKESGRNRVEKA